MELIQIRVDKATGTYADTLEAVGVATLLRDLDAGAPVIRDLETHFVVTTGSTADTTGSISAGFPYIWDSIKEPQKPNVDNILDYQGERQKRDASVKFEQSRKKGKLKAQLEDQQLEAPPKPHAETGTSVILASMRKGWNADRNLVHWLSNNQAEAAKWVRARIEGAIETIDAPPFSGSQILNPISGKGVNAPKTEARSAGSLPAVLIDPFREWMKLRGLWAAMLLYRSDEDFKFFVIEPTDIPVTAIVSLRHDLLRLNLWGGVRLDIEALLRCAQILLRHSDVLKEGSSLRLRGRKPKAIVSGLRVAYFKSLGTAPALMNSSFYPMPSWFAVHTEEDANAFLAIIDEAIGNANEGDRTWGCLGSLQEKHSDDGATLQKFRDWLLTEDLLTMLDFHYSFALHVVQRLSRNDYAVPFSTKYLHHLLINGFDERYDVKEIVENQGFHNIARAIRNATLYALRLEKSPHEVRFGLAQRWKQKMRAGNGEFLTEAASFLASSGESVGKSAWLSGLLLQEAA